MPIPSLLLDRPTTFQPGQLSTQGLLVGLYRQVYYDCLAQLDRLPALYDAGDISAATYREADSCLCEMADTFAALLGLLGNPQPERSR